MWSFLRNRFFINILLPYFDFVAAVMTRNDIYIMPRTPRSNTIVRFP